MNMLICIYFIQILTSRVRSYSLFGGPKNCNTYGPYELSFKQVGVCPGVKITGKLQATMVKVNDAYIGNINMTFPTTVRLDEMRFAFYNIRNNQKNLIYETTIENPCKHEPITSYIRYQLKSRNCVIKKGNYFCDIHYSNVSAKFFGNSFFYGEYYMTATSLSKKQYVLCMIFDIVFSKKK